MGFRIKNLTDRADISLQFVSADLQSVPTTVRHNTKHQKQKLQNHVAFFIFTKRTNQSLRAQIANLR
jgi:hypothetical protein